MPVSPARAAAFDILLRVERESAYASDLLHSPAYAHLSTADHALATELAMGVLRWRSRLDAEIATASSQPLSKLDLEILIALRLALYQFRWLDRIPQRAALHESVELVKRARKRSAAPFVNAVLRKLSATPRANNTADERSSPEALAHTLAHPQWLVERWAHAYGLSVAHQICQHDQSIPVTAIRLRTPTVEQQLVQEGITLTAGALLASARRVQSGDVTKTQAFRTGQIVIQDEASQLVAALVGPAALSERSRILDCCAAPGGKTLAIADHNPAAAITAVELHPHRARLLQKLLRAHPSRCANSNRRRRRAASPALPAVRPRPRRRPLLRHRHARPQSRNQMAPHRRRSRRPAATPARNPPLRPGPGRTRRTPHLLNLFAGKRRKRKRRRASPVSEQFLSPARLPHRTQSPERIRRANLARRQPRSPAAPTCAPSQAFTPATASSPPSWKESKGTIIGLRRGRMVG